MRIQLEKPDLLNTDMKDIIIKPESTIEPVIEIDDVFGNYGYVDETGKYIIEPQYVFANEFTEGLAAVNLNRTWYMTENGGRYYENHFGYINKRGETVIPFIYEEAYPFNKFGVAVVESKRKTCLIDTDGNVISGTEDKLFSHYYEQENRFLEFVYADCPREYTEDEVIGIYDTKKRKVLLEPSVTDFEEINNNELCLWSKSTLKVICVE